VIRLPAHGIPCDQGNNTRHSNDIADDWDGLVGGAGRFSGYSPVYGYIFFGVCYGYT